MNSKIICAAILALLLVAPGVIANSYEYLRVDHIRMPDWQVSGFYPVKVQVANAGAREAEDVHVRTWMPSFSDRGYGMISQLDYSDKGKTVLQSMPEGLPKGEYWVRVTISNDDERRVKHRLVIVG
ncbi:MAG: hypothetical protein AABX47_02655 [Nanoarchaeota archaeon]